ncbi:hypothetical protein PFISCL1PPCAC_6462, partial [Pristionchus fissidentatus]
SMLIDRQSDGFIIWDEEAHINSANEKLGYRIHPDLFKIHSQYDMDSAFEKKKLLQTAENFDSGDEDSYKGTEDAKRVKLQLFDGNLDTLNTQLSAIATAVKKYGREIGRYRREIPANNNLSARAKAKEGMEAELKLMTHGVFPSTQSEPIDQFSAEMLTVMSPWFESREEEGRILKISKQSQEREYLIPPEVSFHIGDATQVNNFYHHTGDDYDFIVMDPPWHNLSVKRKRTYETSDDVIGAIDMPNILKNEGMLAIWVTNAPRVHKMVHATLAEWRMMRVGVWFWLKTTTSGRPTTPFIPYTSGKQPYEGIIFCVRKVDEKQMRLQGKLPPQELVIASTPMCVHSRKPSLIEIYRKMMPAKSAMKPLEIFARSLTSGCASIGYEPLLLQNTAFFEKIET